MQLTSVKNEGRINWENYSYDSHKMAPVPVFPAEYVPTLKEAIAYVEQQMIPTKDDVRQQNKLSMLLMGMETCQKYVKDLGEQGAEMRDWMYQKMWGEYPYDIIEEAAFEYMEENNDYPAPADLKEKSKSKLWWRDRQKKRLNMLLHYAEHGSEQTDTADN